MKTQIEKKEYNEKEFKAYIKQTLREKPQGATLADIVVNTGLSIDWVEYTLRQLMNDYPAYLELNDDQEVVYIFDFSRRTLSTQEQLKAFARQILKMAWNTFVILFKVWIVVMLFTYLLFNILVLSITLAVITRSETLVEGIFGMIGSLLVEIYKMTFKSESTDTGLLQQVFSYVFGETQKAKEELVFEKRILGHLQANKGKLLVSDIVQITGWSLRKSEEQAVRLLADYQGDVEVTEEGIIVYVFPELANRKNIEGVEKVKIWENLIPLRKMNNNEKRTNQQIAGVNGFNMIMAFIPAFLLQWMIFEDDSMPDSVFFFSLVFPFLFSLLFFLIPVCRIPFMFSQNKFIQKQNQEYLLLKEIFQRLPGSISPQKDVVVMISQYPGISIQRLQELLEKKTLELEVDIQVKENGEIVYHFPRINRELAFKKLL